MHFNHLIIGFCISLISFSVQAELSGFFMGNTAIAGLRVLDSDDPSQRAGFYRQVIGFTESRWRAHWSRLVFTAQATPPQQLSQLEILRLLQQSTFAAAYLPLQTTLPAEIKRVFVYSDTVIVGCEGISCSDPLQAEQDR
jgi:hypothetical protein